MAANESAQLADVTANATEASALCRKDFNFLAMLVSPDEFQFLFPSFYIALFTMLTTFAKRVERFAIGIPRGFAKTTFIKLLCVWYVLFSDRKFILIVGASEKLALNTLADICDMLSSRNIQALFGNWQGAMDEDTKEQKVFYFRGRNIILKAIGAGTAIRGINRKSSRPDVIIMDDVQKREDATNKEISEELLTWILSTLMKTKSNSGCVYIYVGNMYPQNCILERLRTNSSWTSLIVGGILADGSSLWEELKPIDELLEEYQSDTELGHPEIFISEVLNSADVKLASGIDITKLPVFPAYYEGIEPEASCIIIDPSSGKKRGDDCTINHWSIYDGKPVLDELKMGTFSPLETIQAAVEMGLRRNTRVIGVEGVAYQSTLLFWFNHYCESKQITGFEFVELSPKGQAKNNRIKRGLLRWLKSELFVASTVRSLVINQVMSWNPLKVDNVDDIIDPIGYMEEFVRDYGDLMIKMVFDTDDYGGPASHTRDIALPF